MLIPNGWLNKTDAKHVIEAFNLVFCRFGLPVKLITDNGK